MSALALMLHRNGYTVSGCDSTDSDLIQTLKATGIGIEIGHSADHLDHVDILVYSSAIRSAHVERNRAFEMNIRQIRRADLLGEVAREYQNCLAIAGTHGKTTTTGMLGVALASAGLDPTVLVGGVIPNFKSNLRLGTDAYFVVEADEYDRSFLTLEPSAAIVTTLEEDHLDIYQDLDDLKRTFTKFLEQVQDNGPLVLHSHNNDLEAVRQALPRKSVTYGFNSNATYVITDLKLSGRRSRFSVTYLGNEICKVDLRLPGKHNCLNAASVIALAHQLGLDVGQIAVGLKKFRGVDRRFQDCGKRRGVQFIDDYAHHPTEVAETISAARLGWPDARIIVVFQPHLYSRTRDFAEQFARALNLADLAIVTGIYPAREKPIPGVSSDLILESARVQSLMDLHLVDEKEAVPAYLENILEPGDMVITMGAGDIWQINAEILPGEQD